MLRENMRENMIGSKYKTPMKLNFHNAIYALFMFFKFKLKHSLFKR